MCKISNKIKFCTCKAESVESLKHYWIFHRYLVGEGLSVLGESVMPYNIDENIELLNKSLLLLQTPVKLTTLGRFNVTRSGRFKLTTSGRTKLTTR